MRAQTQTCTLSQTDWFYFLFVYSFTDRCHSFSFREAICWPSIFVWFITIPRSRTFLNKMMMVLNPSKLKWIGFCWLPPASLITLFLCCIHIRTGVMLLKQLHGSDAFQSQLLSEFSGTSKTSHAASCAFDVWWMSVLCADRNFYVAEQQ